MSRARGEPAAGRPQRTFQYQRFLVPRNVTRRERPGGADGEEIAGIAEAESHRLSMNSTGIDSVASLVTLDSRV
jgi:hypothetical protein